MSTAVHPAPLAPLTPRPHSPEGRIARRRALYHLAAPVAVLTVRHGTELHGTTVSALSTVSREPLLLGACLRSASEFAALAVRAGRYTVNVLTADQADLARYFSDGSRPCGAAQFAPWSWTADPYAQAPRLQGALAHYTCRLAGQAAAGDHSVLVGLVTHAAVGRGEPLISYGGGLFTGPLAAAPDPGPGRHIPKETAA
ncbi:flavin reductase family protein [Streptomyces broussonetiae]|uniref:flavin reductase family protein n=1 Tax=Streptomyces broussonetiae TaxID=2686304 RepID=UPI0035DA87EA